MVNNMGSGGDVDEDEVQRNHDQVYNQGNAGSMSANALGSAAALQALKQFTSGQSAGGSSGGGMQSKVCTPDVSLTSQADLVDHGHGHV